MAAEAAQKFVVQVELDRCLFCSKPSAKPTPVVKELLPEMYRETICKCLGLPHTPFLGILANPDLFYCVDCVEVIKSVRGLYMKLEELLGQIEDLRKSVRDNLLESSKNDSTSPENVDHHGHEKSAESAPFINKTSRTVRVRKQIVDVVLQNQEAQNCKAPIIAEEFIKCEVVEGLCDTEIAEGFYHEDYEEEQKQSSTQDQEEDSVYPVTRDRLISEITSGDKKLMVLVENIQSGPSTAEAKRRRKSMSGKRKVAIRSQAKINRPSRNRVNLKTKVTLPCHIKGCDAKFNHELMRRCHMRREHKDEWKPFKCDLCGCSFEVKHSLYTHLKTHLNQTEEKPFKCHCGAGYKLRRNLTTHEAKHHGILKPTSFQCPTCPQRCKTERNLAEHLKTHTGERPFMCEICSSDFRRKFDLIAHQRLHHAQELNLSEIRCPICFKQITSSSYLRVHVRLMHTGENIPFNCDQCTFRSFAKSKFEEHQRVAHSNDYWFVCTVEGCTAKYKYKYLLASHMRKHNNERRHVCKECSKAFLELKHLKNHVAAIHHANSEELCAKNRCDICGQGFPIRKYLSRHLQKHRSGKLPAVEKTSS